MSYHISARVIIESVISGEELSDETLEIVEKIIRDTLDDRRFEKDAGNSYQYSATFDCRAQASFDPLEMAKECVKAVNNSIRMFMILKEDQFDPSYCFIFGPNHSPEQKATAIELFYTRIANGVNLERARSLYDFAR